MSCTVTVSVTVTITVRVRMRRSSGLSSEHTQFRLYHTLVYRVYSYSTVRVRIMVRMSYPVVAVHVAVLQGKLCLSEG